MMYDTQQPQKQQDSMIGFIFEVIKMFVLALIIIIPIRAFLFQPFVVRGSSMEPNFHERQYLIVNELGYKNISFFHDRFTIEPRKFFNRGDVIVFRAPGKTDFYIKRVIGLPGEKVRVRDGHVTIYNEEHPDGYILHEADYLPDGRITNGSLETAVSEDEYFVLGDNRGASSDSRVFGPIDRSTITGKVLLRAFPFGKFTVF